jgi:reverse gyrase
MVWGITEEQNEQIVKFIAENPYCGIVAPTGSGKSTTMIETLYKKGGAEKIFITEPTVPAAEGLYKYMSNILGKENVGFEAFYYFPPEASFSVRGLILQFLVINSCAYIF